MIELIPIVLTGLLILSVIVSVVYTIRRDVKARKFKPSEPGTEITAGERIKEKIVDGIVFTQIQGDAVHEDSNYSLLTGDGIEAELDKKPLLFFDGRFWQSQTLAKYLPRSLAEKVLPKGVYVRHNRTSSWEYWKGEILNKFFPNGGALVFDSGGTPIRKSRKNVLVVV